MNWSYSRQSIKLYGKLWEEASSLLYSWSCLRKELWQACRASTRQCKSRKGSRKQGMINLRPEMSDCQTLSTGLQPLNERRTENDLANRADKHFIFASRFKTQKSHCNLTVPTLFAKKWPNLTDFLVLLRVKAILAEIWQKYSSRIIGLSKWHTSSNRLN